MSINAKEIEGITNALNKIGDNLMSPNVIASDSNFEAANVVDTLNKMANGLFEIAKEIRRASQASQNVLTNEEGMHIHG
jgi:hypothetical protein